MFEAVFYLELYGVTIRHLDRHTVFVDTDITALNCAKGNAGVCGEGRNVTALKLDAGRLPPPPRAAKTPAPLAFLDAPYKQNLTGPALLGLAHKGWLAPGAIVVVEVAADEEIPLATGYEPLEERDYGAAHMAFFRYGKAE